MKTLLSVFIALFLSTYHVAAQRTFSSAPPDTTKKTNEPVIITEANSDFYFGNKREAKGVMLAFKVNPLVFFGGDIPVYVERRLNDKFSVEASVGVTYKNYMFELMENLEYENAIEKENRLGYSFSAGLRYFPSDNYTAMEGYYFAPEIRHRVYNAEVTSISTIKQNIKQKTVMTDFKLMLGYINYFEDKIFIEYFGGIGLGSRTYKNKITDATEKYDQDLNEPVMNISYEDSDKTVPVISLGFKLGFSF